MKKLFKMALIAGVVFGVSKAVAAKKEWSGLSEVEARAKLDSKLAGKVSDEAKRAEISDKVIAGMKDRGMISAAPVESVNGGVAVGADDTESVDE